MKDSRFIELLNLYIDRQITADETAELEAEIQRHPNRRAVYRQYCQIHTATKTVYESFRAVAADQPAPAAGQKGVVELFETRRRRANWGYYAGGFAAAACLALVFMRQAPAGPAAPALAEQPLPMAPVIKVTAPESVAPANTPAPAFVSLRNSVVVTPDYTAILHAMREQDEERAFSTERLQADEARPLFDDDMFASKRVFTAQEQRVFGSQPTAKTSAQQEAELSAFQFQR